MSLHTTWAACAASIARCLVAATPDLADALFGAMREAGGLPDDGWFRHSIAVDGFVSLGRTGGAHRYRATPPPGIDPATLPRAPAFIRGRLHAEAAAFLRDARRLAGGAPIVINGGQIPIEPSDGAVAAASGVVEMLDAAIAVSDPARTAALLREVALRFLRELPADGAAALATATATIAERRAGCGADGPIWALAQLRAAVGAELVMQSPVPGVLYRIFDPFGRGADPEAALAAAVADLLAAGLADRVAATAAALLSRAEAGVERALNSRSVVAHGAALFDAAGDAWAAQRLAARLPDASSTATAAADIVLHATHALVVDCVNLGSGTALVQHQAQIAADGPAKADELIETYWFYPRSLRDTLIG